MLSDAAALDLIAQNAAKGGAAGAAIGAILAVNNTGFADGPDAQARYVVFILPFDDPTQAMAMAAQMSSCGLVSEGGMRAAGVNDPRLWVSYFSRVQHGGTQFAVAAERDMAMHSTCAAVGAASGAWVDCSIAYDPSQGFPAEGDSLIIGCSSCSGVWSTGGGFGGEHEFTLAAWDTTQPGILWSIDGGQPGIRLRKRAWIVAGGELWMGAVAPDGTCPIGADGRPLAGRRVVGWTRLSQLCFRAGSPGALGPASPTSSRSALRDGLVLVAEVGTAAALALLGLRAYQKRHAA